MMCSWHWPDKVKLPPAWSHDVVTVAAGQTVMPGMKDWFLTKSEQDIQSCIHIQGIAVFPAVPHQQVLRPMCAVLELGQKLLMLPDIIVGHRLHLQAQSSPSNHCSHANMTRRVNVACWTVTA